MQDLGKHFDDIQVMTQVLDSATETNTAATISPEAVEMVKRQVADAHGIQLSQDLNTAAVNVNSQLSTPVKVGPTPEEEEQSSERLKALRLKA
jgi:2-methylcitrate dehydratase PrpD